MDQFYAKLKEIPTRIQTGSQNESVEMCGIAIMLELGVLSYIMWTRSVFDGNFTVFIQ